MATERGTHLRFLFVVAVLWLFLILMIGSAALYGRTLLVPDDLKDLGFARCDSKPCFVGIIPGLTTGTAAQTLLSNYDGNVNADGKTILARVNNLGIAAILGDDGNVISIQIPIHQPNFARLDSFIAMYGLPCSVGVFKLGNRIDLQYPNLSLGISPVGGYVSLQSRLEYVEISSSRVSPLQCSYDESKEDYAVLPWLGFASVERYHRNFSMG